MLKYKNIFVDGIMHLGDIIMSASVFPILKKAYPDCKITYMAMGNLAKAAALMEGVDYVIPYVYQSKGGYIDVFRMAQKLEKEQFDLGISLDPRERVTIMKWLAHIPVRVSFEQALGWRLGWEKLFYTKDMSFDDWDYRRHRMSESFQELMRRFVHDTDTTFFPPVFKPSRISDMMFANSLIPLSAKGKTKIAFCVETTEKSKDWRAVRFAELADQLIEHYNALIIMTGISSHARKVQQIISNMKYANSVLNIVGKTSLEQLIALFRQIDLVITLDTGTAHIAAAAGCFVVTIFSHNSPTIYQAAGENTRTVSANLSCSGKHICIGNEKCFRTECFDAITTDMVMKEVHDLLD